MPDDQLPELGRSLRSLGVTRDAAHQAAHDALFAPLLEARRRAAMVQGVQIVAELRGPALGAQIERGVLAAVVVGAEDPAVARARTATALHLLHPLRDALTGLEARAPAATSAGAGTAEWQAWVAELGRAFRAADDACVHLARLIAEPMAEVKRSRWRFGRGS